MDNSSTPTQPTQSTETTQPTQPSVQPQAPAAKPPKAKKSLLKNKKLLVGGILLLVAAIGVGLYFLITNVFFQVDKTQLFYDAIAKNLSTSYVNMKATYTVPSTNNKILTSMVCDINADFSDTTYPKSKLAVDLSSDYDKLDSYTADFVATGSATDVKEHKVFVQFSKIRTLKNLDPDLKQWYAMNRQQLMEQEPREAIQNLASQPRGPLFIGNFTEESRQKMMELIKSGLYFFDKDKVTTTEIDGKKAFVYDVTVDDKLFNEVQRASYPNSNAKSGNAGHLFTNKLKIAIRQDTGRVAQVSIKSGAVIVTETTINYSYPEKGFSIENPPEPEVKPLSEAQMQNNTAVSTP